MANKILALLGRFTKLVVIAATVCVLLVAGLWFGTRALEKSLRQPINDYLQSRTEAFLSDKNLQGLSITFPDVDLSLVERRLLIRDLKIRYDHKDGGKYTRFMAGVPLIRVDGLDIGDVIWHRQFRINAIRLEKPELSRYLEVPDSGKPKPPPPPPASENELAEQTSEIGQEVPSLPQLVYGLVSSWLPDEIREGRIDAIGVDSAVLVFTTRNGSAVSRDSAGGLSFTIRGLSLDSTNKRVFEGAELRAIDLVHARPGKMDSLRIHEVAFTLSETDTIMSIASFRTFPEPGQMGMYLAGFKRSRKDRNFSIDTVSVRPSQSDSQYLKKPELRRTRIRLSAAKVTGTRVDLEQLLGRRVEGGTVAIGNLSLDVLADRRVPGPKDAPVKAKTFWPQKLADLEWRLQVDTLRVDNGALRYSEWKANWPDPASIWFTNIAVTVAGLTNNPTSKSKPSNAVLTVKGRFLDTASVTMRMEVPVADKFQLNAQGKLEHMPATALNSFVLISDGIRVNSGRIDSATFNFTVKDQKAEGTLTAIYDSLSIDVVDKTKRSQNVGKKLLSFAAKTFFVRGSNLPDKKGEVKQGKINYEYKVGESFWGGFWRAIRSGVITQVKK
ncbi:MAG TPA: DUF748 domain-containing protein [Gemmatimonadales bacterium]|nr:DUF748 domain-containing protein [Gemmatimonadales bacterium]